ncbi:hypothetical protein EDB84DRAFT_1509786 [Lactarius hengduanensis]|nr:hypothetical protein EDB84DRAFT_1509786 [Lactarius hengduanensis]
MVRSLLSISVSRKVISLTWSAISGTSKSCPRFFALPLVAIMERTRNAKGVAAAQKVRLAVRMCHKSRTSSISSKMAIRMSKGR